MNNKKTNKEKNRENCRRWYYEKGGKKWMKKYMEAYYRENKENLRLNAQSKYNQKNKNKVRENIISIIQKYPIKKILTLESEDFIFSNLLPDKKILVFENEKTIYNKMQKDKPKNVKLFFGDISKFSDLDSQVDMVYLDFCGIYEFSKQEIYELKEVISNSKLFAVTFALRIGNEARKHGFNQFGDYQFDLINKLQELLGINFKVLYGEAYKDTQPMVTIVMENPKND